MRDHGIFRLSIDGGVVGPFTTYGATADIFRGENFTRAEFQFLVPVPVSVPEPASLILLGSVLAALAAACGKRSRRR